MTVKILSDNQKSDIAYEYRLKMKTQRQLAKMHNTSERTINRVLVEKGLATPVARIQGEAYKAMQLLKKHGLTVSDLMVILDCRAARQEADSNSSTRRMARLLVPIAAAQGFQVDA